MLGMDSALAAVQQSAMWSAIGKLSRSMPIAW